MPVSSHLPCQTTYQMQTIFLPVTHMISLKFTITLDVNNKIYVRMIFTLIVGSFIIHFMIDATSTTDIFHVYTNLTTYIISTHTMNASWTRITKKKSKSKILYFVNTLEIIYTDVNAAVMEPGSTHPTLHWIAKIWLLAQLFDPVPTINLKNSCIFEIWTASVQM